MINNGQLLTTICKKSTFIFTFLTLIAIGLIIIENISHLSLIPLAAVIAILSAIGHCLTLATCIYYYLKFTKLTLDQKITIQDNLSTQPERRNCYV